MKSVWLAPAALLLACACATTPSAPKPQAVAAAKPAAAAPAKPVSDPDKKICHTDKQIGHNMPVETCHTKAEWAAIRKGEAQGVTDAQRSIQANSGTFMSPPPSPQ